jgi:hypothetical protein
LTNNATGDRHRRTFAYQAPSDVVDVAAVPEATGPSLASSLAVAWTTNTTPPQIPTGAVAGDATVCG